MSQISPSVLSKSFGDSVFPEYRKYFLPIPLTGTYLLRKKILRYYAAFNFLKNKNIFKICSNRTQKPLPKLEKNMYVICLQRIFALPAIQCTRGFFAKMY